MPPSFIFFFFNDTATTEIYTLSLHDALPIYLDILDPRLERERADAVLEERPGDALAPRLLAVDDCIFPADLGLAHVEREVVGGLPDLAQRRANVIHRPLVDGVVRQVELRGAQPLRQDLPQLLDLRRR